jgi:hypothetical protein
MEAADVSRTSIESSCWFAVRSRMHAWWQAAGTLLAGESKFLLLNLLFYHLASYLGALVASNSQLLLVVNDQWGTPSLASCAPCLVALQRFLIALPLELVADL